LRLVDTRVLSYKIENVSVAPLGKWKTNIIFYFTVINLKNDRNLLLKEIAKSCPNFKRLNSKDKLVWLMNTEEKSVLTTIATFILKNMK
jgi:hypothetical protein